ncbi:transglutaminase family protein [soil metagenome]
MIIEIQHETTLRYTQPVTEWLAEMRVEPVSDNDQSCQSFSLTLSQPASINRFQDGFGNRVHHFNLRAPNMEVKALAAAVVETHPKFSDWTASTAAYPLDPDTLPIHTLDYMMLHGPVRRTPLLEPVLKALQPVDGVRVLDVVLAVSTHIFKNFEYAKAVTNASSPIDDVLSRGQGVCQDFAHLMIGILRSFGIPTRYVSGYIHRENQESQSHAWCESWVPDLGWVGSDPTNNMPVSEAHVKVAFGRDYTDVPPNKGIYRGVGEETIFARVETRQLERLPTLSWQEQLPPLHVPLTMVLSHLQRDPDNNEEVQQQQQQ